VPRRLLVSVVVAVLAAVLVAAAFASVSGKGTLTKTGVTSYTYSVQFNQAVTAFQIRFKAGVLLTSFTAPAGFQCSKGYVPTTKQYAIACPSGKAAANQTLKGTVKSSKPLASGGASLYEAGAKLVGPFPISGP